MSEKHGPYFNLKAVVQQTGLNPDTLRAWERRYGLPVPARSDGGHRLYSQRDIDTIKWLVAHQREGLSIRRAVDLWNQIEAEDHDPLLSAGATGMKASPAAVPMPAGETVRQLRDAWLDACLGYDEQLAEQIVNQAFSLYPPETVSVELLQKAVAQIGEDWYRGDVTVQQEHFCSALAIRRLEALVMATPPPVRPGRILAACAPEERHIIGLLLLTFLLRRRGWDVVYLGADVPLDRLGATVKSLDPNLVILSAQQLHTAATLRDAAFVVHRAGISVAYGGRVFNLQPTLRDRITGHFLGEQLVMVPDMVERLIAAPRPNPEAEPIPELYQEARAHFAARQSLVEAHLSQKLLANEIAPHHLAMANRELGLNINAALALGAMDLLGSDLQWIEGLMINHDLPPQALYGYLEAYHRALRAQLDERATPIVNWLGRLLQEHAPARNAS